jgi:hypothetical protein
MKHAGRRVIGVLAAALMIGGLAGCGAVGVRAWQRDILAKPEMQLDNQSNARAIDDHVYFSKEASSGGRGLGGGGCGCN